MNRGLVLGVVAALTAGCFHGDEPARVGRLFDGGAPRPVPPALDVSDARVGRVWTTSVGQLGRKGRACLRTFAPTWFPPRTIVVRRVGVAAETLTFRAARGRTLYGCDDAPAAYERKGPWCGAAVGTLFDGRLRDPRVAIANCEDAAGHAVGFAWITPGSRTRWIAVEEPEYTELYEVAGPLPVRISTSGVREAEAKVVIRFREYAADGREVARKTLEAGVAG